MTVKQQKIIIKPNFIFEMAIIVLILSSIAILLPFIYWNSTFQEFTAWKNLVKRNIIPLTIFIIAGMIIHELVHGIAWAIFCKNGFRSISFGIDWKDFSPYCHCSEPLRLWQFYIGCAMPGIITGIIPAIIALLSGYALMALLSVFFIMAATADWLTCIKLHPYPKSAWVKDCDDLIGCEIEFQEFKKNNN